MKEWIRNGVFVLILLLIAIFFWRLWVPEFTLFESPNWDESDRARDAYVLFEGFKNLNPVPAIQQLLFFETWGPMFAFVAQIPLVFFGLQAHSLSLVSFFAFFVASFGFLLCAQSKLGWNRAFAIAVFSFFWIVGFERFGPYWVNFMIESWAIVGWLGIALSGALLHAPLLVAASWVLFATKYQYFPLFILASGTYLLINRRSKLLGFLKELLAPHWAKLIFALISMAVIHIGIMKTLGPIYGEPGWDEPRALRNPVHVAFILTCVLLFIRRRVFFRHLIEREWEASYVRYFLWPASLLMAFPWPNRWAGVMLTQNAQAVKHSFIEILAIYAKEMKETWQLPAVAFSIVVILCLAGLALSVSRLKREKDLATQAVFVALIFLVQIFTLLFAVNNVQGRFAVVVLASVPIGLFAYVLRSTPGIWGRAGALAVSVLLLILLAFTRYFEPKRFFFGAMSEHVSRPFKEHPGLFPLDKSLGDLMQGATEKAHVRLGIIGPQREADWDMPMRFWLVRHRIQTGQDVEASYFKRSEDFCAEAKAKQLDFLIEAVGDSWQKVECGD